MEEEASSAAAKYVDEYQVRENPRSRRNMTPLQIEFLKCTKRHLFELNSNLVFRLIVEVSKKVRILLRSALGINFPKRPLGV